MTKDEYLAFFKETLDKMMATTIKKNHDYTGGSADPFFNFTRVEALGICGTEQGILTRMMDKMCRLTTFANKGVLLVKDESVEDTAQDLAVYSIMLMGYIRTKRLAQKTTALDAALSEQPQLQAQPMASGFVHSASLPPTGRVS